MDAKVFEQEGADKVVSRIESIELNRQNPRFGNAIFARCNRSRAAGRADHG